MDLVNDMDMDSSCFFFFFFFGGNGADLGMKESRVENGININQLIH